MSMERFRKHQELPNTAASFSACSVPIKVLGFRNDCSTVVQFMVVWASGEEHRVTVCSESDGPEDLQAMAEALRMNEEESQTLMQQGQLLRKSRGLLHGIRALPGRLLGRPNGSSGTPKSGGEAGLGSHWVQFLTEDEPKKDPAASSSRPALNNAGSVAQDDLNELPVSVPSA